MKELNKVIVELDEVLSVVNQGWRFFRLTTIDYKEGRRDIFLPIWRRENRKFIGKKLDDKGLQYEKEDLDTLMCIAQLYHDPLALNVYLAGLANE